MIENVAYKAILKHFYSMWPLDHTDRQSDLNYLLGLQSSFCLFSEQRNGMTTLLKDFTKRVGGLYIDCLSLPEESAVDRLEQIIGLGNTPVLLDEAGVFVRKLGGSPNALDYMQQLSEKRQVGLRLYPEHMLLKEDLRERGFNIVGIGKIPYTEFEKMVEMQFRGVDFSFPERFTHYAYQNYDRLAELHWYVGEAFRLMIERPYDLITEVEVQQSVEQKYLWFSRKKKE